MIGRARPGDPTTAAARALSRRLDRIGRPGRLVSVAPSHGLPDVAPLGAAALQAASAVVVHSDDGGEALLPAAAALSARPLHLVHHGSQPGSDRRGLRSVRAATLSAAGADPAARHELRSLGFAPVTVLDPDVVAGGLDDLVADPGVAADLAGHPGPLIVAIGPIDATRSLEVLIDAFTDLVTGPRPSATLSICGPIWPWYGGALMRRILSRGLRACELIDPADEAAVVARLDRAAAVVALHPVALDPYLRRAADRGTAVVAPLDSRTAMLPARGRVPVRTRVSRGELVAALQAATTAIGSATPTAPPTEPAERAEPEARSLGDDRALLAALGIG